MSKVKSYTAPFPQKVLCSFLYETHHRTTESRLPYGITQCHLPPDTGKRAPQKSNYISDALS